MLENGGLSRIVTESGGFRPAATREDHGMNYMDQHNAILRDAGAGTIERPQAAMDRDIAIAKARELLGYLGAADRSGLAILARQYLRAIGAPE